MTIKTIKYNVQFEVPEGTTMGQLHEDLCKVLHEDWPTQIAWVDIGLPEEEPDVFTNVPYTWDNRDSNETWLWIDKVRHIRVSPFDMIENMVENCLPWIVDEEGVPADEVGKALAVLKKASGR